MSTISVEFDPQKRNLLIRTLESLGWTHEVAQNGAITITTKNGNTIYLSGAKATGQPQDVNTLRVGYAKTVTTVAAEWAKAKGWTVQKSRNKMTLKKG